LYYYRFTQQAFSLPPDGTNGIDKVLSSGNLYLEDFINCNSFDEDNVSISARDYFYSEIIIYPMDYLKKDAKLMYGKMPSKQYEILIDIRSAEEMKRYLKNYGIDDINYVLQEKVKIGNNTYTITGIADGGYTGGWLLEEDYQSISRSNVAAFLINDKDSFMAWADENNLSVYNKYDEVNVDSNLPIFLAGLIIIFLFLFLISISAIKSKFINNIKTIGINRCLGVKKRELAKEFICESIITLNFSALIGIIASIILEFIINFIYADELIIKGFQVILSILSIYTVYITLTIRNLYNLLRSTPAQIMTKYDL
jgi:ABC-type antimicrobial peptide transport system permease subunit